ncbi:DUF2550 family protein [Pengzhenrongella frigida]|uniref:DUF2550 family protein n=1 Tax=Pengzhenrongella frigida TaxID=1259133 RepID=A0A4Q5MYC5_9MICO|nr:DUF2550 family protein [Cellulomonas sp. HLT2-17]
MIVAVGLGLALLGVVAILGLGASRLSTLSGRVGSFVCGARPVSPAGGAVVAGIAQYGAGRLDWWRAWSLSPRPTRTWRRAELEVIARSLLAVPGRPDLYLVQCRYREAEFALTMSPEAYAGLTSWLEAAPPSTLERVI